MSGTGTYNLPLREGATFRRVFRWLDANRRPINLTGATVVAQFRDKPDGTLLHELTVGNGGLVVTPLQGKVELYLSKEQTAAFPFTSAAWDLRVVHANGDADYPLKGRVTLERSVTE